ncbi:hypothetical protein [Streptomyces sp. NPDC005859]
MNITAFDELAGGDGEAARLLLESFLEGGRVYAVPCGRRAIVFTRR